MCDSCGCIPCTACGASILDGVCSGCGERPDDCTCEPLDEKLEYEDQDEEDEEDDEDEDYEEDEDW